jgi:citryl-CoA lyase
MAEWKTSISQSASGSVRLRGYDLMELVGNLTFAQAIFLLMKGELPTEAEGKMMEAILVSSIDHGIAPPSVVAARTVFSGGNPLNAGVAGGVLTIGDAHGGAIEDAAHLFQTRCTGEEDIPGLARKIVAEYRAEKKRIPGFGHRIHKKDPRTQRLLEVADESGFHGPYLDLALEMEKAINEESSKAIPLNVDGAIAAIMTQMGFDYRLGKGFFIIARTPGLVTHVFEEWQREKPFRRLPEGSYEYDGPDDRDLT